MSFRGASPIVSSSSLTQSDRRRREEETRRRIEETQERMQKNAKEERAFLEYVALHPGMSSKEVYRALGIANESKGCEIRDILEDRGLIEITRIPSDSKGKGWVRRTELHITLEGRAYLQQP